MANGTHLCPISISGSSIISVRKKYLLYSYPPKSVLLLIDFSLTVKAVTLIFISGRGSAILSAKEGKSGSINLVKS